MSEGYYSVSSNGSDSSVRPPNRNDGGHNSKMKELMKQSNLRSSSMQALNVISSPDSTSKLKSPPRHIQNSEMEPSSPSKSQSRAGSGASTKASSVETVIFRGRAKSNTDTISVKSDERPTSHEASSGSRVPQATVMPRSASVFSLNTVHRTGISHPIPLDQQQQMHGLPPRVHELHQRYSQDQTPHLRHQNLRALPSYPAHPLSSAYNPRGNNEVINSGDGFFSCVGCGAHFSPLLDERGVVQNFHCPDCLSMATPEILQQQQQHSRYQQRTRLCIDPTLQQSPSKRGSWHAGSEYHPLSYPIEGIREGASAGGGGGGMYPPSSMSTSGSQANPRFSTQNSYPSSNQLATSRYSTNSISNSSDPIPTPPSAPLTSKNSSSRTPSDPSKWESLRLAADSIIREKDSLIDKQRHQIQQLEQLARQAQQQSDQGEQQHLRRYPSTCDPYSLQQQSKDLDFKMQEFQYETASVRAQLTEASSASKMELDDLTRKLAETELDAEKNKRAFHDEMAQNQKMVEDAKKRLTNKQGDYDELKLKYKAKEKELSRAKKNLSNIETYLSRLPTPQEVEEREARLEELEQALRRTEQRTKELEGEVFAAKGEAEAKATVIQSLEQADDEWKVKLEASNRERDKYRDLLRSLRGGAGAAGGSGDSDSGVSVEDMEDEIQRLKGENERLKKLLESQQKRHKTQQRELKMEQQDLEDQLKKEQVKVTSLETKLKQREAEVERLRDRVNDDDAIKESLRERVTQLTEELSDAATGGEEAALREKMQQRLTGELAAAFTELQGLVQICNDEVEGKDPNMSVLLGLRSSGAAAEGEALDAAARLAQAKALRKEVDRLRSVVSNKIAENMGDNLDCSQQ